MHIIKYATTPYLTGRRSVWLRRTTCRVAYTSSTHAPGEPIFEQASSVDFGIQMCSVAGARLPLANVA
jgi:hypothetical protein